MELREKRRVRVTEKIPISRPTVTGLIETFQTAFRGKDKPVRVLYCKGEDLLIERAVLQDADKEEDSGFLTPYQMIRQHAELEIQEILEDPLMAACIAVQELRKSGVPLTFIVVMSMDSVRGWLPREIDLSDLLGVEVFVDPDAPEDCVFFCGSQVSPMIRDIEKAICCRMV